MIEGHNEVVYENAYWNHNAAGLYVHQMYLLLLTSHYLRLAFFQVILYFLLSTSWSLSQVYLNLKNAFVRYFIYAEALQLLSHCCAPYHSS